MCNENEIWVDIEGYEGLYKISNYGRVKSLERIIKNKFGDCLYKEIIKKNILSKRGYYIISLCKNSIEKQYYVHRLVAINFIPKENEKTQVNHIDSNKLNNSLDNLEWVNNRENSCHNVKISNKTSKYTGVSYFKRDNKWRSSIQYKGETIRFGMFKTEEEAYQKRVDFEKANKIVNKYI